MNSAGHPLVFLRWGYPYDFDNIIERRSIEHGDKHPCHRNPDPVQGLELSSYHLINLEVLNHMQDYTIRTMTRGEIDMAVEWAAREGWNPGLHDANCYFAADPNGFLIGLLSSRPIATISVVKYGGGFGFLGFYIVSHPPLANR